MPSPRFHGLERSVLSFSGARALRVVHPGTQQIPEHRHDWPLVTVAMLGGYDEHSGRSAFALDGPTVSLHPAGHCHANCIHNGGMETFSLEFDPAWLGSFGSATQTDRSHYWTVGPVLLGAHRLANLWRRTKDERILAEATGKFISAALHSPPILPPQWLLQVERMTAKLRPLSTLEIAQELDLNPAWLANAYRRATGLGLREHLRRRRIEAAVTLLRSTDEPIAAIAAETGFCDQSHLNRAVRALTGCTPVEVRRERAQLQALLAAA